MHGKPGAAVAIPAPSPWAPETAPEYTEAMGLPSETPTPELVASIDHRVVLHNVSWADYERLLAARGEGAGVRMTYLKGELELMSPSKSHEGIKKGIARLLEAWAEELDLELNGFGAWTLRSEPGERGLEPDECYILGEARDREVPDLAIEVEWTRGLVDKIEVYRGLGVPELWIWRAGRIDVQVLRRGRYQAAARSALLPALDLALLVQHLEQESQTRAVKSFRAALRRSRG